MHPPEAPPAELPALRGVHIYRTAIIMPFFSAIFVALRLHSTLYLNKRKLSLDDYVVLATMVSVIVHAVLMGEATKNGMGLHIWQFTPELNQRYYLWIGISSQFYVTSLMGFKSALLLLYLRLFGVHRRFKIACYLALFFTLGYLLCNLLTEFLGCTPIAKKWDPSLEGFCIDRVASNIAYGAGHMISDLIIAILPLTMIWSLKMRSTRQKIGFSLVLSSGFLAWAVACVRWAIGTYNMLSYDRPWWAGISFLFSILEVNTGLICACVATLGPLFGKFWRRVVHLTTRSGRSKSTNNMDENHWGSPRGQAGFSDVTTIGGSGGKSRKMSEAKSRKLSEALGLPIRNNGKNHLNPDDEILLTTTAPQSTLAASPQRSSEDLFGSQRTLHDNTRHEIPDSVTVPPKVARGDNAV